MFSFEGLDAKEELCEVVKDAAGVRVVIFTGSAVLEIVVALVVEHLVRRQVHGGIQELERKRTPFWQSVRAVFRRRLISHREPREQPAEAAEDKRLD